MDFIHPGKLSPLLRAEELDLDVLDSVMPADGFPKANWLIDRYYLTGDPNSLDEAVDLLHGTVQSNPYHRAQALSFLGELPMIEARGAGRRAEPAERHAAIDNVQEHMAVLHDALSNPFKMERYIGMTMSSAEIAGVTARAQGIAHEAGVFVLNNEAIDVDPSVSDVHFSTMREDDPNDQFVGELYRPVLHDLAAYEPGSVTTETERVLYSVKSTKRPGGRAQPRPKYKKMHATSVNKQLVRFNPTVAAYDARAKLNTEHGLDLPAPTPTEVIGIMCLAETEVDVPDMPEIRDRIAQALREGTALARQNIAKNDLFRDDAMFSDDSYDI